MDSRIPFPFNTVMYLLCAIFILRVSDLKYVISTPGIFFCNIVIQSMVVLQMKPSKPRSMTGMIKTSSCSKARSAEHRPIETGAVQSPFPQPSFPTEKWFFSCFLLKKKALEQIYSHGKQNKKQFSSPLVAKCPLGKPPIQQIFPLLFIPVMLMADHSHTDTCGNICFCQFISFISKVNTGHLIPFFKNLYVINKHSFRGLYYAN